MAATFDTHDAVKKLESAGVPAGQAEAVVNLIRDTRSADLSQLATKDDLRTGLHDLEQRLTIKVGAMLVVLGGFLAALKFFG